MNSTKIEKQKGFQLTWKNSIAETFPKNDDGFYPMRTWQCEAFHDLKDSAFMILNAPMGSGKSWMMCLLSAFKMKNDSSLRSIIVVPQTIIAPGFTDEKIQMPDGEKLHWQIEHNLCNNEFNRGTVNYFIKWLENPSHFFSNRTILCTHATLIAAYKKLKTENRLYLFSNILLWIDEAHHVKNVAVEGFEDTVISNSIGQVAAYFLDNADKNLQMGLTTASFFRGDRADLITDRMGEKFKRYNLPYDKYLASMKHLKSFSFDFLLTGHNYTNGIELLIKSRKGKDIIYIPHPISQYSTGNKKKEVDTIINLYGTPSHITKDGVTIVYEGTNTQKILDLVNETQRDQKKDFLSKPILKKQRDELDAIIALGMFKEGANWIWADRIIIVGPRSSLVDVIQMIGRPFRDAENKNHVEIIQLLPFSLDQQDKDSFRENLNNYLKAIYASLILENILNPVKINVRQKTETPINQKDENNNKVNWLSAALPDEAKQQSLIEEVNNHIVDIAANNHKETINIYDEYNKIIPEILERYGITEHKQEVSEQILGMFIRRGLQMKGLSVENIDFDLIHETHPLEYLLRYTSGACDINTFEKLREAIRLGRTEWLSFQETRALVRNLGLKSESQWQLYLDNKIQDLPPFPDNIPRAPWAVYKNSGWVSMGDFLGTNQIAPSLKQYCSYEEAKNFVHALNIKRKDDWVAYCKTLMMHLPPLPLNIPASPAKTYKRIEYGNKWISWGDFLGTGKISNQNKSKRWMSYAEAHKFVSNLNLIKSSDWLKYTKNEFESLPRLPSNLPKKPEQVYVEWVDWPTFLGNTDISKFNCKRSFWSFEIAREFMHKLGLKNQKHWNDYCAGKLVHLPQKPLEIPSNPNKKYKNVGWVNLKDWLGN